MTAVQPALAELYEADETAWLETMSRLVARRAWADLDQPHLAEYLSDMAKRDKREVQSRLVVLLAHLLKWQYQPDKRSTSWQLTVAAQRQELRLLLASGTLRGHAADVLDVSYADAVEQAAIETRLPVESFPDVCPFTLDDVLDGITLTDPPD
jgi:hypothetical protein